MKTLTEEGRHYVKNIAEKYKVKTDTVEALLRAIVNGNGSMAQFNIQELGGQGQWMKGGMVMVGDMFNNSLRSTVENLANELARAVSSKVLFESTDDTESAAISGHRVGSASGQWPAIFGNPTSSGSQNNFKYAYFAPVRRLVIDENGKRTIYDTKQYEISGISQQQGSGQSYQFTGPDGTVNLSSLSVVSEIGEGQQSTPDIAYDVTSNADLRSGANSGSSEDAIISTIEKVKTLYEKGHITEEEFKTKKQELLARL